MGSKEEAGNDGAGSDPSSGKPLAGSVGTVMLKPNSDNALERQGSPAVPEDEGDGGEGDEEGSESESSDGFLKGLQSDDSFHGMLPDEDINKLLQLQGDYILHTVEKDEGKGRVIGMSILWNKEKIFIQVRAGECGVTFNMVHYKSTIIELTKFHLLESVPVTTTKNDQPVIPRRPVLREDWELRHDDVELLEKLGEGAFGEVRLGKLKQKNKGAINVAVKVIKGNVTKKAVEEAMKEARIMRKYQHPNVVRFYGVQAEVEPLMLIMEFVKGGSLDSYLKKNHDQITVNHRASMCYDAACGLEYLHVQNCIHRDIAARNCLMDVVSRRLKLSDFGLSSIGTVQVLDPSKPAPIRWLSPEVIRTGCFAKPADVWSFGVLCWEIYMDAEVPYKEFTMGEVQKKIMDEGFRLRLPLTVQTELRKLIALCWIGDPNKRPTMSECVRALKPFFDEKRKYMSEDAIKKARKQQKKQPKKKKPRRDEKVGKDEGDSRKSAYKTQKTQASKMLGAQSQKNHGQPSRKKPSAKGKENDDTRSREKAKHKNKGNVKNHPTKSRGKTRKGESQKSDSVTDKENNSHKAVQQKERKHRSPSPPNSKATKNRSAKKSKDRKRQGRGSGGSDEDKKHKKGSDEDRRNKDSTNTKKKKSKSHRKN